METLDSIIQKYKQWDVDFLFPSPNDNPAYLDLYLMRVSKDKEWNEVQVIIFEYFNNLIEEYRNGRMAPAKLLKLLEFPEVEELGLGHCEEGTSGRGTNKERAELLKKYIFDDPKVKQFGIKELARASILIKGIGPDLLSDMVANFAIQNLLKYTDEQVKTYNLKTISVPIKKYFDFGKKEWSTLTKVSLPVFENGNYRILAPRQILRRMPTLSATGFYLTYLKYILQEEETARLRIVNTIGEEPDEPLYPINELEEKLKKEYKSIIPAVRTIASTRPGYIEGYLENPNKFEKKRRPKKLKIDYDRYIDELKLMAPGKPDAYKYSHLLLKFFTMLYPEQLLRGKIEMRSVDGIYHYDINFLNASTTNLFKAINNQQIKAASLIVEAKNYSKTNKISNEENSQALAYTVKDGRELVFLARREDVIDKDIERSQSLWLRQKIVILPLSDKDIIRLIENKKAGVKNFDDFLEERLQKILSA